jgi:hypothetical protein
MNSETIPRVDGQLLVGLTIDEAKAKYPGIWIRASKIDGKSIFGHADCRLDRYNVEIENSIIINYTHNG